MIKLLSLWTFAFFGTFLAQGQMIDEVRVPGVQSDWVESVRAAGGYFPGEMYSEKDAQKAATKIKDYLGTRGFPQAEVKASLQFRNEENLIRNVLEFKVVAGKPVSILKLDLKTSGRALAAGQLNKVLQSLDFKPGEPFDQERIKGMKKSVETALAAMNFVDSRVLKVEGEEVEGGVNLALLVEIGQQVEFSFSGHEVLAKGDLAQLVELQKQQGLGRDYVSVLKNRVLEKYHELGYLEASVESYSFEGDEATGARKILFKITEGVQYRVKEIQFDGNEAFSKNELQALFYKNASDRVKSKIYNAKMVEEAAKSLVSEIKSKGYLTARLVGTRTERLNSIGQIKIYIFIAEGLQTQVESISFQGNEVLGAEELTKILAMPSGEPLNLVQLEDGLDRIRKEYRNRGYLDFSIKNENEIVSYSEKNQFSSIDIVVEEGSQYRLADVKVFGNDKTKTKVILREVQVKQGEVISESKVLETEDRLRRLGIFAQVATELQDESQLSLMGSANVAAPKEKRKILKIAVQEATPGTVGLGVGFRNDLGFRLFGEVLYSNLGGNNHTWVLNVSGNRRVEDFRFIEYSAQMSYIWPWLLLGETTFRPSLSVERRQYIQFDAETFAYSMSLERSLVKRWGLTGSLTYSLEQVRQFNASVVSDNQQIRIGSITPLLRLDRRDNPLMPRQGFYALTSFEYANNELGSQGDPVPVNYGRFQLRGDFHFSPMPQLIWYTSLRGGWIKNFANTTGADGLNDERIRVPLIKQFALGGVNSLRGYLLQEINVQNQIIQGYSTFVNYRTQLDFFFGSALSFGPFLDAGNLNIDDFTFGRLKFGSGVGMRYITPLGPVNFDWGFKLFPRPGEDPNVFYFSLGVI